MYTFIKNIFFQNIKSHLQELGDESIPLELTMKPFLTYDEGRTAIQELTSTQTMISSLINNSSEQSKTEAMQELRTNIETFEQILLEFKNNDDKDKCVSFNIIIPYNR